MFLLKKIKSEEFEDKEKRERLFFHDIINQTHGLLLFLNQKSRNHKNIDVVEIEELKKEIQTLQSLIKEHFDFKHKNLSANLDIVPFSIAQETLMTLIQTYLNKDAEKIYIHQKGFLAPEQSLNVKESALVNFPIFYRIMNNLIKNIAEAKSAEVHFTFDYSDDGFFIETRNKINSKLQIQLMADKIKRVNSDGAGLGLESIHYLSSVNGGHFEFEIENDFWINKIRLPKITPDYCLKELSKKAA